MGIITLTKHPPKVVNATAPCGSVEAQGAGAPEMLTVSTARLAATIRAELAEWFHDSDGPTLGEYAVGHIVGGIIQRVVDDARAGNIEK